MKEMQESSVDVKDLKERTLKSLKVSLGRLLKRHSVTITEYDPTYKVAYLGNVLTGWAKGEGCVEKPLSTLWRSYTSSSKPDVQMKVTVTHSGLKAVTKEHGLTEYWSHRITYCAAPPCFPRIFCWVYRHEGRKLKQELRCHAVLCPKRAMARRMATELCDKLAQALVEFRKDKISRQNARLSLTNSVPRRKILLSTGSHNYRPPLERSKSAPKLTAIEEDWEEESEEENSIREDMRRHSVALGVVNGRRICTLSTDSEQRSEETADSESNEGGDNEVFHSDVCSDTNVPVERRQSSGSEPEDHREEKRVSKNQKRVCWDLTHEEAPTDSSEGSDPVVNQEAESDESFTSLLSISSCGSSLSEASEVANSWLQPEDEEFVDLRPSANFAKSRRRPVKDEMEMIAVTLMRSASFPMFSGNNREEDNISDESGYSELVENKDGFVRELIQKDVPPHQILKTILSPASGSPQCV